MADSYRTWLQGIANSGGGLPAQEATALLQVVGDDYGVNQAFLADPYKFTNSEYGQVGSGYGPQGISRINDIYSGKHKALGGGQVLGLQTDVSGGSGSGSGQDAALYDQAIAQAQSAEGRLNNQLDIGLGNVGRDYTNNLNRLISAKNQTQSKYEGNKTESTKDNISARSDIDFQTGQRANSLQRLLGARGAGNSSAARTAAPYAAALEGTQQLNQVTDAFTKNMGALDTSWNEYGMAWDQSREDLDAQKKNQENAVRSDVTTKRADLLSTIAQLQAQKAAAAGGDPAAAAAPYTNRVNDLYTQVDNLGRSYEGKVKIADPTYQAPDLAKYEYNPRAAVQFGQTAGTQAVNPYINLLLGAKDKKQNPLLG